MARGRSGPVVSLFAFQDIITSVSGILIVVVLLMALELIERPEADAASPAAHAKAAADAVAAAEAELGGLRAELSDKADSVQEAAGTSAAELQREIEALEVESERVAIQIRSLKEDARSLKEAAAALEVRRFDAAKTTAELEESRRRIEDLRKEVESVKSDDRVVFTLPQGFKRSGWLVVIDESEIAAAPIGAEARPTAFRGADHFLDWSVGHRGDYYLLLVRPAGIDAFDVIEAAFRSRDVTYGFDVIGQSTQVLHPQRGSAP